MSALPAGPTSQAAKSSAACAFGLRALIATPETLIGLTASLPAGSGAIAHLNGSLACISRLARLLAGVKSKVNLIPLNAAAGIPFERPSDAVVDAFARILAERGLSVSVRKSRGRDIRAACGQLIVEGQNKSAAQQLALMI